ncbi:HTH domain-containing protein [Antarctobacter heliothermus]|uniref:Predicted phosphoesterase, NUDIX family n=1 Tax=Antarctobacter heliothermus TaxID=74033 RepID=A0A239MAQ7_9RHOB|nr:HTH domain-containing protein [Antarctobacter heliothermus]SNT39262.1 Predicted phosphoesterase, NUDIX family [Antarctobacter heliothermus]
MANQYLIAAEKAIRAKNDALTPREILAVAQSLGFTPGRPKVKTRHKTMAARLSMDVLERGNKSLFFRTGPNTFFLRELNDGRYEEYKAPRRKKTLHDEKILAVSQSYLDDVGVRGVVYSPEDLLKNASDSGAVSYLVRRLAETRYDVKQVIAYALIYRDSHLLSYTRGKFNSATDELVGQRSIGFGGHVSKEDISLFDEGEFGIFEAARREITEELVFQKYDIDRIYRSDSIKYVCAINTYDTDDAKKHIAVVVLHKCHPNFQTEKNEMSINALKWLSVSDPLNDIDCFEPWSKLILEEVFSGNIALDFNEE